MPRTHRPQPHNLDLRCACTYFGTPMVLIAAWAASFFRHEGADYLCPNCNRRSRALLIPRLLGPDRLRVRRL